MPKINELRKCPFCGSRDVTIECYVATRTRLKHYFPNCNSCHCWDSCLSREEAAAVWNRRETDRIFDDNFEGTLYDDVT
jgi:hypothetical protein